MTVSANLDKLLDKKYESRDLHELVDAPVHAIAGISNADAAALKQAFGIETIGDLGRNPYVKAATAITTLAEAAK